MVAFTGLAFDLPIVFRPLALSVLLLSFRPSVVDGTDTRQMEKGLLRKVLGEEHSQPIRPPGLGPNDTPTILSNGPVTISVSAIIKDALLNTDGDSLRCVLEIVETWIDYRLSFDSFGSQVNSLTIVESSEGVGRIWQTETSVVSGEAQNAILARIRLYPSGHVDRLLRFEGVTLPCFKEPFIYPYGPTKCTLAIGSLAHFAEEVEYRWNNTFGVSLAGNLRSSGTRLHKITMRSARLTMPGGVTHSSIEAMLILRRPLPDLLLRMFFPYLFSVLLACSVLLPSLAAHATPITAMALIILLSTISVWSSRLEDIFSVTSILGAVSCVYIFAAYLIALCISSPDIQSTNSHQGVGDRAPPSTAEVSVEAASCRDNDNSYPIKELLTSIAWNSRSLHYEHTLRIFVPVSYLLFAIAYIMAVCRF